MVIIYRLQKYAIAGGFAQGHWSAATSGFSTLSRLVQDFNSREDYDRPLEFAGDGLTPVGVYKERFTGSIYALQLEMTQLENPTFGNVMKVVCHKQWIPNPICPWQADEAWGKAVPPYRMEALTTLLETELPDLSSMERGFVAGVIKRSIERDTLARNEKSILRYLDVTLYYRALATAMTG